MTEQDYNKLLQETKEYADKKIKELSDAFNEDMEGERTLWHELIDDFVSKDKREEKKRGFRYKYEYELNSLLSIIDSWNKQVYERYDDYNKKYSNPQHSSKIDFNKLVNEINSKVPERFKNEPVKTVLSPPFFRGQFGFDPSHYSFINKEKGWEVNCTKGETYIIEQLYSINKYKDYNTIAPLFILTVMRDYEYFLKDKIDKETIDSLIKQSGDLLARNGYDKPDYRYKHFIVANHTQDSYDYIDAYDMCSPCSEEELSLFIVNLIDTLFKPFDMVFFTWDENELWRAKQVYKNIHEIIMDHVNDTNLLE